VGRLVTEKRPLRTGLALTSAAPTLIFNSFAFVPNSFHVDSNLLQAGHQGAKLFCDILDSKLEKSVKI
jgi:hypothetical protein